MAEPPARRGCDERDMRAPACDEPHQTMFKTPFPAERPLPLLVHKHPYTFKSNGEAPRTILTWARQLASYAARKVASVDATGLAPRDERARLARALRATRLDSLVSILYRARGALRPHVDHGLEGLGLAVSLGSSCEFRYGDEIVELRSGDALFGNFGSVEHEVVNRRQLDGVTVCYPQVEHEVPTRGGDAPAWWRRLPAAGARWRISRFGRARAVCRSARHGSTARVVGLTQSALRRLIPQRPLSSPHRNNNNR